jgi:outer membrane protein OmpA-like peptidoglycan-associated protein
MLSYYRSVSDKSGGGIMASALRALGKSARFLVAASALFAASAAIATVLATSAAQAQGMTLDICPSDYGSFPEDAPALTCGCSAEATEQGGVTGTNPYFWQSSPCRAAVHAGAVGTEGGQIVIEPATAPFFPAVTRNGVEGNSYGQGRGFRIMVTGATTAPSAPQPPTSASTQTTGMTLDICPSDYGSFPEDAPALTCGCSAEAVKDGRVIGANPYFWQSAPCRAALHAGAVSAQGGQIVIEPSRQPFFPAVTRNGIEGDSYGEGKGFRVVVSGATTAPTASQGQASTSAQATGMTLDICPSDYGSFPEDAPNLTCGCSAEAAKEGRVIGANPYFWQSSLCRAAVHAGAVGVQGGQIVIEPSQQPFFPAVTRNGVEGDSYGKGKGFRVVGSGGTVLPEVASAGSAAGAALAAGMTLDICPSDYGDFPEDAPALTCGCSADAVKGGRVIGANPYFWQSAPCRAALHAGAVGAPGGQIVMAPEAQPFFPAVTRNGVEGDSYGKGKGFRVTAVPGSMPTAAPTAPEVDASGKPVQAPIAATLRATGRVQLYINFATDKDKPLPSSEPVLQELLATLQGDPALRVELIGHTDSQGSAPYNLDLSQRRAAAVYLWLIQHGIDSGRLRSDGHGLMEPIADNETESGRALNRRVEVKALN